MKNTHSREPQNAPGGFQEAPGGRWSMQFYCEFTVFLGRTRRNIRKNTEKIAHFCEKHEKTQENFTENRILGI